MIAMEPTWHSVHVHYHDRRRTDELILGGVKPLFAQLAADAGRAYFLRHWLRGPHVRINVHASAPVWRDTVRPLIDEVVGSYLREMPSAGHPDPETEQRMHLVLAEKEEERGELTPWRPDNSICEEPYDQRLHVLGTPEAAEMLAGFHVSTTPLAFELIGMEHVERLERALCLMFATAQVGCPPITQGFLSYRSHAEGYLASREDPERGRDQFEEIYQANKTALADLMTAAVASARSAAPADPLLTGWLPVIRACQAKARELHAAGRLPLPALTTADERRGQSHNGRISAFHEALFGNETVRDTLNNAEWFHIYRILLNYQYLFFTRAGITPVERFMLCYLAARTVEDAHQITLDAIIGSLNTGEVPVRAER